MIGDDIRIRVAGILNDQVSLSILAPHNVVIQGGKRISLKPDADYVSNGTELLTVIDLPLRESITIGDNTKITLTRIGKSYNHLVAKLGIEAPREIPVHRRSVYNAIQRESQATL